MNIKNSFLSFLRGFKYAFHGIIKCIKSERNLRVHMSVAFYVLLFMQFYNLTDIEKGIVFLTIGFVISMEIINTAIESVVDLCSPEYHNLAQKAKDAASGAVLCSAIISVVIGIDLFWNIEIFKSIYAFFTQHLLALFGLIFSLILWSLFIFVYPTSEE